MTKVLISTVMLLMLALSGAVWAVPDTPTSDFVDNGDGTVQHKKTGLVWMRCALGQTWDGQTCKGKAKNYTYDQAVKLTANYAGHSDWRLPTVRELQTLVERENKSPAINTTLFPNTTSSRFWSSSPYAGDAVNAWSVNFSYGYVDHYSRSYTYAVRLVRGGQCSGFCQSPAQYTVSEAGTVVDEGTGLMWSRCSVGQRWNGQTCTGTAQTFSLAEAQQQTSTLAGYTDWRVPTASELATLVDYRIGSPGPTLDAQAFPNTPSEWFWSSSPYAGNTDVAWFVSFISGYVSNDRSYTNAVRLVRGGQCSGFCQSLPADTTPDGYTLSDPTGITPGQVVLSNVITVSGINAATPISINGGSYSINGGAFTGVAGTVNNGDRVQLRLTASSGYSTTVDATLTIGGVSDTFTVTTQAPLADTTPDAFAFNDPTGITPGQVVLSNVITVSGINAATSIGLSGTGAAYSVNGGGFVTQPGTVNNGDLIQLRLTASSGYGTSVDATLTIGGVSDTYTVSTQAPPADTTPDAFAFNDPTGITPGQVVLSNVITVSGINAATPISLSGTGAAYSVNGGGFVTQPGTVNNGDLIQLRLTASSGYGISVDATLTIGGVSDTYTVSTQAPLADTTPDAFHFDDLTGVTPGQVVLSNAITVSGINAATSIGLSGTGAAYSVNGGGFVTQPGTVNNGDLIQLRLTASSGYGTSVDATLTIGGVSDTYTVSTQAPLADTTPDAFAFNDPTGITPGQVVLSNVITVSGINAATPISINGGSYSINGGAFTGVAGTVNNGDRVQLRLTASSGYGRSVDATLTIGGVSDTYTVSTLSPPVLPSATSSWSGRLLPPKLQQPTVSSGISYGQAMAVAGNQLWIGAPLADSAGQKQRGVVYRWKRQDSGDWVEAGIPISEGKSGDTFGRGISLSDEWAFIAAPMSKEGDLTESGRVYIYSLTQDDWANKPEKLKSPDSKNFAHFGWSLALSGDWLAVGAPGNLKGAGKGENKAASNGEGVVYLYKLDNGRWTLQQTLNAPGKMGRYGARVAMEGDRLVVGAPTEQQQKPAGGDESGAVYAYRLEGDEWKPAMLSLPPLDKFRNGHLGEALALQANSLLVGAPQHTYRDTTGQISQQNAGRVFSYGWDEANQGWSLGDSSLEARQEYITKQDQFGSSVVLADGGRLLLIGAPGADQTAGEGKKQNIGRVYLYQAASMSWSLIQVWNGRDTNDGWGQSVALRPDAAWVSTQKGKVWLYQPRK